MILRSSCIICRHVHPDLLAFLLTYVLPHAGHNHTGHGI